MTVKLLIASHNPGKLREYATLLAGLSAELVLPRDIGLHEPVPETGATYADNARLKAEAYARAAGLVTVGDDSGLEVEALGGAPGLHSARYAGQGATDADRRQKLMQALRQVPAPRPARFVCSVAVAHPDLGVRLFEGICPGEIILEERGTNGFGYDPIFWLPELGATLAELPNEMKNQLSHRARAVHAARPYLSGLLAGSAAA